VYSRPVRLVVLGGLAALALVVAGCGGERLSKSEFDAKTSAICAGYTKRARAELVPVPGDPLSPTAKPEQLASFGRLLQNIATLFGRQLDDLREVRPPNESKAEYIQVLRLYAQIENALTRGARAARRGDKLGVAAAEGELAELGQQADKLGFRCE
jgi:hypothetical protein